MPNAQLKRAERAISLIRGRDALPPEAGDALEELVGAVKAVESRLSKLEDKGHAAPTAQMDLPNRS
jgi:hypothetical protein